MIEKDGYLPPREVVFKEIIEKCGKYWTSNFSNPKYLNEKLTRLAHIKNEGADVMFALAMFHPIVRNEIIRNLSPEAQDFVKYYNTVNENQESNSK